WPQHGLSRARPRAVRAPPGDRRPARRRSRLRAQRCAVGGPRGRGRGDAPQRPVGESPSVVVARLVQFALARPLVIVAATLVLAGAGVWAFRRLKVEAYPDLTDPTVVVITLYSGFAAEEV